MKMYCYRVTFQFTDDAPTERRAALVDAETGLDAIRQIKKIYEDVGRIFRAENLGLAAQRADALHMRCGKGCVCAGFAEAVRCPDCRALLTRDQVTLGLHRCNPKGGTA